MTIEENNKHNNLLSAIDFEISRIDSDVSRAGWNFWILLGSIATLGWLLLEELGKGAQTWDYSLLVFMILTLVFDLIANLNTLIYPSNRNRGVNRFFVANVIFGHSRHEYIFILFRNSILWGVVYYLRYTIFLYQLLLIYYAVFSILVLIMFSASFVDAPLRPSNNERPKVVGGSILVLIISAVVIFIAKDILSGKVAISVSEYKIGALVFGISYLASNMLLINKNTYQRTALTNIRRDFLLENLNFDQAKKQTEILLLGMQADDVLQKEIELILDLQNQINKNFSEIDYEYTELMKSINPKKIAKMSHDEVSSFLELTDTMFKKTSKIDVTNKELMRELVVQFNVLSTKQLWLGKDTQLPSDFIEKAGQAIAISDERFQTLEQHLIELGRLLASLGKRYKLF